METIAEVPRGTVIRVFDSKCEVPMGSLPCACACFTMSTSGLPSFSASDGGASAMLTPPAWPGFSPLPMATTRLGSAPLRMSCSRARLARSSEAAYLSPSPCSA